MNLSVLNVVGHGRSAKRGLDAANSYHLEQLKMLLKGDQITFIDGETEREGVVVRIDRFNRLLDIEVGQQILRIPVHQLKKAEGMLHVLLWFFRLNQNDKTVRWWALFNWA